jgi:outer membrane protein OmpA-like peptidoglycan-associated protein
MRFDAEPVDVTIDWQARPADPAAANATLTATDGTGLRLETLDARAVIYGPLAFTELHFKFRNPDPETREGTFVVSLPSGASVVRFAMPVGELWQEAEVVPLRKARAAYEEALNRKVDPAVLEKTSDTTFRGRVFPIFGGREKEIVIAYTETLERDYRLQLAGLPVLDQLDAQVLVPDAHKAFVLHRSREAPAHDVVVPAPSDVVRGGHFSITRLHAAASSGDETPGTLAVLIDTSASSHRSDIDRLEAVLAPLTRTKVTIDCFDQEVVPCTLAEAKKRRPAGATNLRAALKRVAELKPDRALFLTDGVGTLAASDITRVDVLPATNADRDGILALTALGSRPGAIIASSDDLLEPAPAIGKMTIPGAAQVWPSSLATTGIRAATGFAFAVQPQAVDGAPEALLERAVVEAEIRDLDRDRAKNRTRIEQLSLEHRILTPLTAMLILESDEDYKRFEIPRVAMTKVPIVGSRGVEIMPRSGRPKLPPRPFEPTSLGVTDEDGDGIPDLVDQCPSEPETFNGYQDEDGCPDRGMVIIDSMNCIILKQIYFPENSAEVTADASEVLDETALVFIHHPEFELIGLYGNTAKNEKPVLADKRAEAVNKELVKRGLDPHRFYPKGWGATRPQHEEKDDFTRTQNRRVSFRILVANGEATGVEDSPDLPSLIRAGKVIPKNAPYEGELGAVMTLIEQRLFPNAEKRIDEWLARTPDDVLAWIALGRLETAKKNVREAARAYGSLLELAHSPAQRRVAAMFLESAGERALALEAQRDPDRPTAHRAHAWSLAGRGRIDDAIAEIAALPPTADLEPVILRDLATLHAMKGGPSKPFAYAVLTWETEASDLDLVATSGDGRYQSAENDVKTGFGPELLILDPKRPRLEVHLIRRGPAGHAIGKVTVYRNDGRGHVAIEDHPFVIQGIHARLPL